MMGAVSKKAPNDKLRRVAVYLFAGLSFKIRVTDELPTLSLKVVDW